MIPHLRAEKKERASQPAGFVRFDRIYEVIWWMDMEGNGVLSPLAIIEHGVEPG